MSKLTDKIETLIGFWRNRLVTTLDDWNDILADARKLEAECDELKLENGRLGKQLARVPRAIEAAKREVWGVAYHKGMRDALTNRPCEFTHQAECDEQHQFDERVEFGLATIGVSAKKEDGK
jgi:regulator of replication initiation timing